MALRCFVASAFGHSDVDKVFTHGIRPVLKQLGIAAQRVDKIEHNDDIDDRIFTLLNKADLCIADLTYARPSVYYEAGYAAGQGKPVIYIVRTDHFRRRTPDEDPQDKLRVHFDLQMKNIIRWDGSLSKFQSQLTKRIRFVLRKSKTTYQTTKKQLSPFSRLSIDDKREKIARIAHTIFLKAGFNSQGGGAVLPKGKVGTTVTIQKKTDGLSAWIVSTDHITKTKLVWWIPRSPFHPALPKHRAHLVIVSLSKENEGRIHRLLPAYQIVGDMEYRNPVREGLKGELEDTTIHVIAGTPEIDDIRVRLSTVASVIREDMRRNLSLAFPQSL